MSCVCGFVLTGIAKDQAKHIDHCIYAAAERLKMQNQELQKKLEMAAHVERCAIINEVWGPSSKASRDWLVGKMKEQDRLLGEERERCAKLIEAHKAVCSQFHDDCAAQVAAEIRKPDLKRLGSSPTERPCCVEAYARGYDVGRASR